MVQFFYRYPVCIQKKGIIVWFFFPTRIIYEFNIISIHLYLQKLILFLTFIPHDMPMGFLLYISRIHRIECYQFGHYHAQDKIHFQALVTFWSNYSPDFSCCGYFWSVSDLSSRLWTARLVLLFYFVLNLSKICVQYISTSFSKDW